MSRTDRDLLVHIEAGLKALSLEAWRHTPYVGWETLEHFTIAEELDRVDRAIGPRGASMFAKLADDIRAVYTELEAARAILMGRGL